MKKYKLKLWYPGLPEKWKKEEIIVIWSTYLYKPIHNSIITFTCYEIENNPLYWEEVKEPEYTILSFKGILPTNDGLFTLRDNGKYYWPSWTKSLGDTLQGMLSFNGVIIYSVKNNKTGEIFSIGDRIKDLITKDWAIITGFYINSFNDLYIKTNKAYFPEHNIISQNIAHDKPVFTTSDGVDMYLGDPYCCLVKESLSFCPHSNTSNIHFVHSGMTSTNYIYFSTQEAAQKYIDEHNRKPLFKTEDGVNVYKDDLVHIVNSWLLYPGKFINSNVAKDIKVFSTKEKAEEYILMNKPVISLQDCLPWISETWNKRAAKEFVQQKLK